MSPTVIMTRQKMVVTRMSARLATVFLSRRSNCRDSVSMSTPLLKCGENGCLRLLVLVMVTAS